MSKSNVIEIGVNQRILWIGGEAYPLRNIARARTVKLVRTGVVSGFVKAVLLWAVLGVGGVVAVHFAGMSRAEADKLTGYVMIGALALIVLSLLKLLVTLARRTMYALVIETAGTPHTAVVSPNVRLLDQLVHQITHAINTGIGFTQKVENYYGGNHVKQYGGSNNTGIGMVNQ